MLGNIFPCHIFNMEIYSNFINVFNSKYVLIFCNYLIFKEKYNDLLYGMIIAQLC